MANAQDAFGPTPNISPAYSSPPPASAEAVKEEEECNNLIQRVYRKYEKPSFALLNEGKFEQGLENYSTAIKLLRKSAFKSSSLKIKETINRHIASTYFSLVQYCRKAGRHDLAGNAYMELFCDPESPQFCTYALQAGEEYLAAKQWVKAKEAYGAALKVSDQTNNFWAQQGIWKAYIAEGNTKTVGIELKNSEGKENAIKNPEILRAYRISRQDIYKALGNKDETDRIQKQLDDKHCPICGSDQNIEPIAYGLIKHSVPGYHLGGCCVSEVSPRWWCTKDKVEF